MVADLFSALIPNSHRGLVVISLCLLTVWESILPSTSFVSSEEVKMRGASLIRWQFLMIILLANCRFFWLFFWEQTAAILVGYGGCINQVLGMLKDWQSKNKNKENFTWCSLESVSRQTEYSWNLVIDWVRSDCCAVEHCCEPYESLRFLSLICRNCQSAWRIKEGTFHCEVWSHCSWQQLQSMFLKTLEIFSSKHFP